jgi:hypothetical protein
MCRLVEMDASVEGLVVHDSDIGTTGDVLEKVAEGGTWCPDGRVDTVS